MNKIKQFRKKMGMTQKELSEKSGISRPYISKLENNECIIIKSSTMVAIANALDVSADTLLIDVVAHSVTGVTNELTEKIEKIPIKEQKKIIKVIHTLLEE